MAVGNVISLTPPRPGLPGLSRSLFKPGASGASARVQDSSSDASSDDAEGGAHLRGGASSRPQPASGPGASLWKPVFLSIAFLNILALGGLLYSSSPWTHREDAPQTGPGRHAQRELRIPAEFEISRGGKASAKLARFLGGAPASLRKKLLRELEVDALRSALRGAESQRAAGASEHAEADGKSASEPEGGDVASS